MFTVTSFERERIISSQYLDLSCGNIGNTKTQYIRLGETLKGSQVKEVRLASNEIGCEGLKYLTDILKDTEICALCLHNNNISNEGIKYLAKALKDTKLSSLNLSLNNISDEGVKYLAEVLKESKLTALDLSGNVIGIEAAEYFTEMLGTTNIRFSSIDLYYEGLYDHPKKYISQLQFSDRFTIILHDNKIGSNGAQYLQNMFQKTSIAELELYDRTLEVDDAEHLAQALKGIKIQNFRPFNVHIIKSQQVEYLIQAFKETQIAKLDLTVQSLNFECLVAFLKEIKIIHLDLSECYIADEGMKHLAPELKKNSILYINLNTNNLHDKGIKYLAEILPHSTIIQIDLSDNNINTNSVRNLAKVLPLSQVTRIALEDDYQYLLEVAALQPNDCWLTVNATSAIAKKIRIAFKELVSFNQTSSEFEFTLSEEITNFSTYVDQCIFLFETFKKDPNSKAHVIDMICRKDENDENYDMTMMNKVNEFLAQMPAKFHEFFENKLPDLLEAFENFDFVTLVLKFEDMEQYDVVQDLLLHRVLYYVDENQEILHPYIYKLLNKHDMPLYSEGIELNKKEKIISYFENHQEIDGAQEIVDMLKSKSFE